MINQTTKLGQIQVTVQKENDSKHTKSISKRLKSKIFKRLGGPSHIPDLS